MNKLLTQLSFLLSIWIATPASAQLRLPAIISDHMVVQRSKSVPVWGWADPGESIVVTLGGQSKSTIATTDGRWSIRLDSMSAATEPQSMFVHAAKQGIELEIKDVLIGEVWMGSGQSNMAMAVSSARDFPKEKADSNFPKIRMFKEDSLASSEPQSECKGKWLVASAETVGSFSATLYFFGRELHQRLEVPVGLINSSVGGTPIESWIPAFAQSQLQELRATFLEDQRAYAEFDEEAARDRYERELAKWKLKSEEAKAAGQPAPNKPGDTREIRNRRGGPGFLFNGKIAPLVPYSMRGIVWYQGEANTTPGKSELYKFQLPLLVSQWRGLWGEELPFAWVQLPNYKREGDDWMLVQQAMLETLRLDKTGMAITVDIGDPNDIHPKNKQDVGHRLALWALGAVYSMHVGEISGPLPDRVEVAGSEIVVTFRHTSTGLTVSPQSTSADGVKGFEIAGADKTWMTGQARIEGNQVFVSNPQVTEPVAVRYAWAANPDCNLFNKFGLPASPFRSENWPASKLSKEPD